MRIAYLSNTPIPSRAATSVHVMKMCHALATQGHDLSLHTHAGDRVERANDDVFAQYGVPHAFEIHYSAPPAMRAVGHLVYATNVRRRIRAGTRPDLLYARHLYSLAAAAGDGVPMVYEAHAPSPTAPERLLEGRLFRHADFRCLVVATDAQRRAFLARYPALDPARVVAVPDAADVPPPHRTNEPAVRWPSRAGVLQVGYVGHLSPGKGMEIVAALPERLPDVDFHVVGGTEADLAAWRARVSAPNLTFHGFVPHARLGAYYHRCHVLLVPLQRHDAPAMPPLKLFEYMAHGRAIIISDLPVLEDVIEAGVNGLVAPSGNPDAWARQIARLRDHRALGARLGTQARATLVEQYTWRLRATRVLAAAMVSSSRPERPRRSGSRG